MGRSTNASVSFSAQVPAPPARVYAVLSDYHVHHPAIVPKDAFRRVDVIKGGKGAGTRFELEMVMMGRTTVAQFDVTEPEPGRVMVETMLDQSLATTFTMDPIDGGRATQLTFATDYTLPGGIFLPLLRWMAGSAIRRIYQREMANIAQYIAEDRDLKRAE